jgi:hypothetical protein
MVGTVAVLTSQSCPDTVVTRLWAAAPLGVIAVARVLLDAAAEVGDLVVVDVSDEVGARVLVRGAMTARSGADLVMGDGALTWVEGLLPRAGLEVAIGLDAVVTESESLLPFSGGIVPASLATWSALPRTAPADSEPAVVAVVSVVAGSDPSMSVAAMPDSAATPEPEDVVDADVASAPTDADLVPELTLIEAATEWNQLPGVATEPVAVAPVDEDSYDRLFGATQFVAKAPDTAALEVSFQDDTPPQRVPTQPDALPPEPVAAPTPAVEVVAELPVLAGPGPPPSSGALISGVPLISSVPSGPAIPAPRPDLLASAPSAPRGHSGWPLQPPLGPAPSGQEARDVDDGLTVSRAAVASMRSTGPQVQGVRCPQGHPNPAEAVVCRVCRHEVPSQVAITMPRPSLGALVAATVPAGAPTRILLDGPLLLGRKPLPESTVGQKPTPVVISSPDQDLSRNHLRVTIDGWHVLVTDLGSTNGTVVEAPGEAPERIHPQRPTMITPGTRVTLAAVATYVYEVTP